MLRNLRAKSKRMGKRLMTLRQVVKELNNRPVLENHKNEVEVACYGFFFTALLRQLN